VNLLPIGHPSHQREATSLQELENNAYRLDVRKRTLNYPYTVSSSGEISFTEREDDGVGMLLCTCENGPGFLCVPKWCVYISQPLLKKGSNKDDLFYCILRFDFLCTSAFAYVCSV
jgi:hypothetical protein